MNIKQIIQLITAKDSPLKRVFALNKAGTTRGDVLQVIMSFVAQEWITKLIDGMHKTYQQHLGKLPAGHLLEIRLLPDIQKKQLKIVVEDVHSNGIDITRTVIHEVLSRDINPDVIEAKIAEFMGGKAALTEPFNINDLIKKQ